MQRFLITFAVGLGLLFGAFAPIPASAYYYRHHYYHHYYPYYHHRYYHPYYHHRYYGHRYYRY